MIYDYVTTEATTFQVFIVFVQNVNDDRLFFLIFESHYIDNTLVNLLLGEHRRLSWTFENYTSVYYERIHIDSKLHFTSEQHLGFKLFVPQSSIAQGYPCQYGGIVIRQIEKMKQSQIGPVCSTEYANLLHNVTLFSKEFFLTIYSYGQKISFEGHISLFHSNDCPMVINPCGYCVDQDMAHLSYILWFGGLRCKEKNYVYFYIRDNKCGTFIQVPNEYIKTNSCNLFVISQKEVYKFQITHRYFNDFITSNCLQTPYLEKNYVINRHSFIESMQTYQSIFGNFSSELFCYTNSLLIVKVKEMPYPTCETIFLKDIMQDQHIPEFIGVCFKFNVMLSMRKKRHQMKVYYSRYDESLVDYMNRFIIISHIESNIESHIKSQNNKADNSSSITLSITDHTYIDDKPLLFQFTGNQLPLIWKSYGQFLDIVVDGGQNVQQTQILKVIAMAVYDSSAVISYLSRPISLTTSCPHNATYTAINGCWSIHDNFRGNWDSANQICQERGGYLWSVNDSGEWDEVLASPKYTILHENRTTKMVLKPINAIKYFRTSSVIFLGLKVNSKVTIFLTDFVQFVDCSLKILQFTQKAIIVLLSNE